MTNDYGNHMQFLCLKLFDQGKTVFDQTVQCYFQRFIHTHYQNSLIFKWRTRWIKKDVLVFYYDHRNKKKYTKLLSNYHIIN